MQSPHKEHHVNGDKRLLMSMTVRSNMFNLKQLILILK